MKQKLFGTDGVRGRANKWPMTADVALRLAAAAGRYFRRDAQEHRVVIGKDTRLSGYMLENALTAGFTSTGMNVFLFGPVPTPAIGYLTHSLRADLGVMISASHNPAEDNGIKFFGPDGFKLSDEAEAEIERLMEEGVPPAQSGNIGRARRYENARERYVEFAKNSLPRTTRLDGLRIVLDCANGAAYRTAPQVLWELGAEVFPMGVEPNGFNINEDCGSTSPEQAARRVRETRADVGICLDGDADRVILIDENGTVADGDQIMGLIASRWKAEGRLANDTLVATVMSNLGLERYLGQQGIALERTAVGDRYVVERMQAGGFNLGGEQSGHIVMTDHATTGDGLLAALQFLSAMVETGQRASELASVFSPVPQKLVNVRFAEGKAPLDTDAVQQAIADGETALGHGGRLLIRKSGTEPLIRVMGEAEDMGLLDSVLNSIVQAVRAES
ncbi:phosphoglucosamine mutase [Pseudooceanicola sediminis]|uniref:Phosphoglucosamine mutase n=1 Tax=Pseudooceanicola sediminis TaxID=2211117 RepID=A0A399J4P3_9RHOB|nr:phosphoglucosamine mutase [Pseudooceanicola sediminis]KAA2315535.1 phosphoglucosamine mutase [Puniceibacterium sp. HSS470]RII40261.1 phosphoglucosamine mutase [Pseudooceanicola sediminis]|tara:strand:- start:57661 stop:59001 length:1341 start_codon:yes stop_codon:yes gene_type:complete